MKHEGPDSSEALPVGEESLTPEELDRLATCMFEINEIIADMPGKITEKDVTPKQWIAIQALKKRMQSKMVDDLKRMLIEGPPEDGDE